RPPVCRVESAQPGDEGADDHRHVVHALDGPHRNVRDERDAPAFARRRTCPVLVDTGHHVYDVGGDAGVFSSKGMDLMSRLATTLSLSKGRGSRFAVPDISCSFRL